MRILNHVKIIAIVILLNALTFLGCGDSREKELTQAVDSVKAILELTERNPLASTSFQEITDMGGSVITYITANSSADKESSVFKNLKLEMGKPSQPWTVVIKQGTEPLDYIIEGYGESIEKPLYVEKITIHPMQLE